MRDSYMLYTDKLEGEYKEVFQQVDSYVTAERIDEDTQEAYMGQLLDAFLAAQQEGKPVEKLVGKDVERFCKSFCEDFTWKTKLLAVVDTWKNFAWVIFIMSTLEVFSVLYAMSVSGGREIDFWTEPYEFNFIGYFLAFMLASILAAIMGRLIRKAMFQMKKVSMRVWQIINWFGTAVIFLIMLVVFFSDGTNFVQFPGWTLMLGSGVVLLIYYVLNRKRVKERGEAKVKFWDKVAEDVAEDVPKVKVERFVRINKRRSKRGKPALSWQEYVLKEDKEYQVAMKLDWIIKVLPFLIVGGSIWNDISNQNFGSWVELFIMYGVAVPIFILWMRGLNKGYYSSMEAQRKWIDAESTKIEEFKGE